MTWQAASRQLCFGLVLCWRPAGAPLAPRWRPAGALLAPAAPVLPCGLSGELDIPSHSPTQQVPSLCPSLYPLPPLQVDVLTALDIGRKTFSRIKLNYLFAFVYNLTAVPIAAGALYPGLHFQVRCWGLAQRWRVQATAGW